MKRRALALVLLMALLASLCSGCLKSTEELYQLPQQSDEYFNLQEAINAILVSGAEYSAPLSGSNQQAVQLADLDGDGEDEAIAFVKTVGELPLKAYIFDKLGENYQPIAVIEGNGSSFESVEYIQLDGEAGLEIVVGWQVSNQVLKVITVYSLRTDGVIELVSANYSAYRTVDLTSDGLSEIFLVRDSSEGQSGVAELYCYSDGLLKRELEASLSASVSAIKRIITGYMDTGVPAVFVASVLGEGEEYGIVTDVFAMKNGVFQNVAPRDESGMISTVRNYFVYATDIDQDGLLELPNPVQLRGYNTEPTDTYWKIQWYNLTLDGEKVLKQTTYHNYSGGWYLVLEDSWEDLVVYRGNAVGSVKSFNGYVFALWDGRGEAKELFTIYAFSGDNRNELANSDGRFVLAQKGDVTYAAKLGGGQEKVSPELLRDLFRFIKVDWITGEM